MFPSNLLINADDFGLNLERSNAIADCVREGLIQSISVLPFSDSDDEHLELLHELQHDFPKLKIGAHLSLIETEPRLDSTPRFHTDRPSPGDYREFLSMYGSGRMSTRHVYYEWRAQIQCLIRRLDGGLPSHLDSHQHVHILPGLWQAIVQLRSEFQIPRLRIPYEGLASSIGYRFPFGLGMQVLALLRSWQSEFDPVRFSGFFTSMDFTLANHADLPRRVLEKPNTLFELMVHPGPQRMLAGSVMAASTPRDEVTNGENEKEELRKLRQRFVELQAVQAVP